MKTVVVDVGGGLRGFMQQAYLTGVWKRISVLCRNGVSAGSANIASYIAGQKGRNYHFYTEYSFRKDYMSFHNFLVKKSYIDMDYLYGKLSNSQGENPLDYASFKDSPVKFIAVATNAWTGEARYFDKTDMRVDDYGVLKASCSIPFVCQPYVVEGIPYYDGAVSDPVPIEKAFSLGADKVVLILTKPRNFQRTPEKDKGWQPISGRNIPLLQQVWKKRAENYNRKVTLAKELEKQGKLLLIAPDDTCGIDTLTRDKKAMERFYEKRISGWGEDRGFLSL